ncbi:hypothetical protein BC835DRAFT_253235 [Cytidiella melzeri]|nr:hypothetical protein BC835DRAFT_253235 [Cytidiella melzeri]
MTLSSLSGRGKKMILLTYRQRTQVTQPSLSCIEFQAVMTCPKLAYFRLFARSPVSYNYTGTAIPHGGSSSVLTILHLRSPQNDLLYGSLFGWSSWFRPSMECSVTLVLRQFDGLDSLLRVLWDLVEGYIVGYCAVLWQWLGGMLFELSTSMSR